MVSLLEAGVLTIVGLTLGYLLGRIRLRASLAAERVRLTAAAAPYKIEAPSSPRL